MYTIEVNNLFSYSLCKVKQLIRVLEYQQKEKKAWKNYKTKCQEANKLKNESNQTTRKQTPQRNKQEHNTTKKSNKENKRVNKEAFRQTNKHTKKQTTKTKNNQTDNNGTMAQLSTNHNSTRSESKQ